MRRRNRATTYMALSCLLAQAAEHNSISTVAANERPLNTFGQETYGVDISFPIHRWHVSTNYDYLPHNIDPTNNPTPDEYKDMPVQPLGDKQSAYDEFLRGCQEFYGEEADSCDGYEEMFIEQNLLQPQSMQNYTDMGFKKIKAPEKLFGLIRDFWDKNHMHERNEKFSTGDTVSNHWASPAGTVDFWDEDLEGTSAWLRNRIWAVAQMILEEWTGLELTPCSLYGIRVYKEGSVLRPHVDRLPLVSSAIINVAQDIDEPWPLEVYGRDGKAYNVTMEPGDMVLYESHSLIHGRPFPLKGRFYANVFIHFEPLAGSLHDLYKEASEEEEGEESEVSEEDEEQMTEDFAKDEDEEAEVTGEHDEEGDFAEKEGESEEYEGTYYDLPPYIIPGSPYETHWRESYPDGWVPVGGDGFEVGSTLAHSAAEAGDLDTLEEIASKARHNFHRKDYNGWQPIHHSARGGSKEALEILLQHGADLNERTEFGDGPTPLRIALETHGEDHPIVSFLRGMDAVDMGPEL